jgi:hypothetical protein
MGKSLKYAIEPSYNQPANTKITENDKRFEAIQESDRNDGNNHIVQRMNKLVPAPLAKTTRKNADQKG